MHLHEEYVQRHKILVPLVKYDSHSQIILKSREKPYYWRILNCQWHDGGHRTGFFEVSFYRPVHDGYRRERMIIKEQNSRNVHWDEYEDYILDIIQKTKPGFLSVKQDETSLAAWHIFLYIYDSWLYQNNSSSSFMNYVGESLNPDTSLLVRKTARDLAIRNMSSRGQEYYENQVKPWSRTHSNWLEDLVNG